MIWTWFLTIFIDIIIWFFNFLSNSVPLLSPAIINSFNFLSTALSSFNYLFDLSYLLTISLTILGMELLVRNLTVVVGAITWFVKLFKP